MEAGEVGVAVPHKWKTLLHYRFKAAARIIILELSAVVIFISRLVHGRVRAARVVVLVDSALVKGAGSKGRSSSKALNRLLTKVCGVCLRSDLVMELTWEPTWGNPGDVPSRGASLAEWRRKVIPLWSALVLAMRGRPLDADAVNSEVVCAALACPPPGLEDITVGNCILVCDASSVQKEAAMEPIVEEEKSTAGR